jgi:hypothetical protein
LGDFRESSTIGAGGMTLVVEYLLSKLGPQVQTPLLLQKKKKNYYALSIVVEMFSFLG